MQPMQGSKSDEINEPLRTEYKLSPYRWYMLMSFSLLMSSSAFCMVTFAPMSKLVALAFDSSNFLVNSAVTVFLCFQILLGFYASQVLEYFGLNFTFKVCAIGNMIGAWGRYLSLI